MSDTRLTTTTAPRLAAVERRKSPPACDVYENDSEILLVADVPGVTKDAVDVRLDRGELTLSARPAATAPSGTLVQSEYGGYEFERRFVVPDGIDANGIAAELQHGVLILHLPKSEAVKPRQIPVRAG
jgi:HSP20 family molecular chaperone IbpA